jgi:hypothetical protein
MLGLHYFCQQLYYAVQTNDNIKTGIAFTVVRICHEQVMCIAVRSKHFLPQQQ